MPVVRNAMLAAPVSTQAAIAIGRVGATATKPTDTAQTTEAVASRMYRLG
jgi:hypothetical protein